MCLLCMKKHHTMKLFKKVAIERNNLLPSSLLSFALVPLELLTISGSVTEDLGGKGEESSWKGKRVKRR